MPAPEAPPLGSWGVTTIVAVTVLWRRSAREMRELTCSGSLILSDRRPVTVWNVASWLKPVLPGMAIDAS